MNTIRIATLLGDKKQGVVYAFLRIGVGAIMDNVDCGGMAARVDLDTGKLLTVGADKAGNTYDTHPTTGTPIIGFTVPYFKEAMDMCLRAAQKVPQMRFIAWDVAVTNDRPLLYRGQLLPQPRRAAVRGALPGRDRDHEGVSGSFCPTFKYQFRTLALASCAAFCC